jgi:hypothetical protein
MADLPSYGMIIIIIIITTTTLRGINDLSL